MVVVQVVQVQVVQVQVVAGAVAAWRWPVGGMPTCARKCAPGIGHADLAAASLARRVRR